MTHRPLFLSLAACAAAAAVSSAAGAAAMKQHFTITSTTAAGKNGPTRVLADGAINGRGTVDVTSSHDSRIDHMTLHLGNGTVFLVAVEKVLRRPPRACKVPRHRPRPRHLQGHRRHRQLPRRPRQRHLPPPRRPLRRPQHNRRLPRAPRPNRENDRPGQNDRHCQPGLTYDAHDEMRKPRMSGASESAAAFTDGTGDRAQAIAITYEAGLIEPAAIHREPPRAHRNTHARGSSSRRATTSRSYSRVWDTN